jgi:hypothetical protein
MTLQEQLDGLREAAKKRIPPDTYAIMQRHPETLRASGILDRVPRVGDRAPEFTLPDGAGRPVSLERLLAQGPVVLSFFRGRW